MREMLIGAARTYYMGMINKHMANMEVLLTNPTGIGEDAPTATWLSSDNRSHKILINNSSNFIFNFSLGCI